MSLMSLFFVGNIYFYRLKNETLLHETNIYIVLYIVCRVCMPRQ